MWSLGFANGQLNIFSVLMMIIIVNLLKTSLNKKKKKNRLKGNLKLRSLPQIKILVTRFQY